LLAEPIQVVNGTISNDDRGLLFRTVVGELH
jgi:hypothetical protein